MKESKSYYYVRYRDGFMTSLYADLKIPKSKFEEWRIGKFDATDWSKVERVQPKPKQKEKPLKLDSKQQKVMNYLMDQVLYNKYILEKDIVLKGISKTYVKQIVKDSNLLEQYGLKRVRATKQLKDELGIASKGYPFIITKKQE